MIANYTLKGPNNTPRQSILSMRSYIQITHLFLFIVGEELVGVGILPGFPRGLCDAGALPRVDPSRRLQVGGHILLVTRGHKTRFIKC